MGSAAFDVLPPAVRAFHTGDGVRRWTGHAEVRRGSGPLARFVCTIFGFPATGSTVPTRLTLSSEDRGERWVRDFGGAILASRQWAGQGLEQGLLLERFGPACFATALIPENDRLRVIPRRWFLFGCPMPCALLPSGEGVERDVGGRFSFDITIGLPVIGLVVAYRGILEAVQASRENCM
ncbi:DUF4166 domain-containing protein [Xaviernesmea oryzae]|nr:DUF4166 domain-containing protein [Xaviernesmea oryzae]